MALACQAACASVGECCHGRSGQQDSTRYLGDDEILRDLRSASAHDPLKPIWPAEDIGRRMDLIVVRRFLRATYLGEIICKIILINEDSG